MYNVKFFDENFVIYYDPIRFKILVSTIIPKKYSIRKNTSYHRITFFNLSLNYHINIYTL